MYGIWILLLLIATAALPAIIVFLWFRSKNSPVTLPWFLISLVAGIISLVIAAMIQDFVPASGGDGLGSIFFSIFVRIALVEELSRIVVLVPLLIAVKHRRNHCDTIDLPFAAALGFVAGVGFSILESAFHGMTDIKVILLRAFTVAPLHGACGIRVGAAMAFFAGKNWVKAVFIFLSAVFIHGAYNLTIVSPALSSVLAVLIAFTALFSSLPYLKAAGRDDENIVIPTELKP